MRNLKKVLSLALCLVMLLGMMVVGASAVETNFPDNNEIGEEYKEAALVMSALKIFEGDDQGNMNPGKTLTRAEAAKIMTIVMLGKGGAKGFESSRESTYFTDMKDPSVSWACGYVDYCASVGIIKGNTATTVNPKGTLKAVDFATMLLRAARVDEADTLEGPNYATRTIAAASKYGIADVANIDITREAAAKMALEGILVSPTNKNAYSVTVGGTPYTFDNAADAYFFNQANGTPGITIVPAKDTLASKNFGLTKDTTTKDSLGLPTVTWTATNPKAEVVVPSAGAGATLVIKGALDAQQDKTALKGYTFDASTEYSKDGGAGTACSAYSTLQAQTGNDTVTYVYATGKEVKEAIIVTNYASVVTSVTAAGEDDEADTVRMGGKSFKANGYQKGDYVLYNLKHDALTAALNPHKASVETGTMTKFTNAGKYTVGGETYELSGIATSSAAANVLQGNVGNEVTIYLDDDNKIVAATAEAVSTQSDYIFVLGNSDPKTVSNYMSGGNKVVEITGINTAGEVVTHEVSKVNGSAVTATPAVNDLKDQLFSFVEKGETWELTAATKAGKSSSNIAAGATSITDSGSAKIVLNSATTFVFIQRDGSGNFKSVTVKTGNANIGDGFVENKAQIVTNASGKVALTVYVDAAYTDGSEIADNVVYFAADEGDTSSVTQWVDGKKETVKTCTVYDVKGDKMTLTYTGSDPTQKIYTYTTDGALGAAVAGDKTVTGKITAVEKDTIGISTNGDTAPEYYDINDASIACLGDDGDLAVGQTVAVMLTKASGNKISAIFVTADQATATLTTAPASGSFTAVADTTSLIKGGSKVGVLVKITVNGTLNQGSTISGSATTGTATVTGTHTITKAEADAHNASFNVTISGVSSNDVTVTFSQTACAHDGSRTEHAAVKGRNCTTKGTAAYYTCDACGANFQGATGTTVADAAYIANGAYGDHHYVKTNAKTPTCVEEGGAAYWSCDTSGCTEGKKYVDNAGEKGDSEITPWAVDTTAAGHHYVYTPTEGDEANTHTGVCDRSGCTSSTAGHSTSPEAHTLTGGAAWSGAGTGDKCEKCEYEKQ